MRPARTDGSVERYATLLKRLGYAPAFGRIFGYLASADPPLRSFDEVVSDLRLSKGSVSTVLRSMQERGLVDYVYLPGDRRRHFRVSLGRWRQGLERKIEDSVEFVGLLRQTRASFGRRHPDHRQNLLLLIEFERLFQARMNEVIAEFARRSRGRSS